MLEDPLYAFSDALDSMLEDPSRTFYERNHFVQDDEFVQFPRRPVRALMDDAMTWQWIDVDGHAREGLGRFVAEVMLEVREAFPGKRVQAAIYARSYSPDHRRRMLSGTTASQVWDYEAVVTRQIKRDEIQTWLRMNLDKAWKDALRLRNQLQDEAHDDPEGLERKALIALAKELRSTLLDEQAH